MSGLKGRAENAATKTFALKPENGKGSQASSENQAAQKDPQNDELDNTNPAFHDTADDVTERVQQLNLGDKYPESRMGQEKEECGVTEQKSVDKDESQAKKMSTYANEIPYTVLAKICCMLNTLNDVDFNDFRMLGELMKIERHAIDFLAQPRNLQNSTLEILKLWRQRTQEATVEKLIGILKHKDLHRPDVVEILENWVEKGDSN